MMKKGKPHTNRTFSRFRTSESHSTATVHVLFIIDFKFEKIIIQQPSPDSCNIKHHHCILENSKDFTEQ